MTLPLPLRLDRGAVAPVLRKLHDLDVGVGSRDFRCSIRGAVAHHDESYLSDARPLANPWVGRRIGGRLFHAPPSVSRITHSLTAAS